MNFGIKSAVLIIALMLVGCSAAKQARDVKASGFLKGHYNKLQKGKEGEVIYIYKNPKTDFKSYRKILLDPILMWRSVDSDLSRISKEDLKKLANFFYTAMYKNLSKDYEMVQRPQTATLRVQIALTSVEESSVIMEVASTIVPTVILFSQGKELFTGKPTAVGEASLEAKITDAMTGELLAAGISRRYGGKQLDGFTDSWEDVKSILQYWADKLAWRFCMHREETNCKPPQE